MTIKDKKTKVKKRVIVKQKGKQNQSIIVQIDNRKKTIRKNKAVLGTKGNNNIPLSTPSTHIIYNQPPHNNFYTLGQQPLNIAPNQPTQNQPTQIFNPPPIRITPVDEIDTVYAQPYPYNPVELETPNATRRRRTYFEIEQDKNELRLLIKSEFDAPIPKEIFDDEIKLKAYLKKLQNNQKTGYYPILENYFQPSTNIQSPPNTNVQPPPNTNISPTPSINTENTQSKKEKRKYKKREKKNNA